MPKRLLWVILAVVIFVVIMLAIWWPVWVATPPKLGVI
jgi:hypothetical protein